MISTIDIVFNLNWQSLFCLNLNEAMKHLNKGPRLKIDALHDIDNRNSRQFELGFLQMKKK